MLGYDPNVLILPTRSSSFIIIIRIMSFCEFEQNENDAAIISSLLFLMDSNREVRPEDHNNLGDIDPNIVDHLSCEQACNQSIIESTKDDMRKSAKEYVGSFSHLPSSVESQPPIGTAKDIFCRDQEQSIRLIVGSQSVDSPVHSANGELRRQSVSQTNQFSLQVAICSDDNDQGKATVRGDETGNKQKSL